MSNKKSENDPFAAREAKKYDNPIPSREFIEEFIQKKAKALSYPQLARALDLQGDQQEALRRRLRAMERDGQLIRNKKGAYNLVSNMGMVQGRYLAHKDGYGFIVPEDGSEDIYLNNREARAVFHDDEVLVRVVALDNRGRREAIIVEVLARNTVSVVGRYFNEKNIGIVEPSGRVQKDISVPSDQDMGAHNGQFVSVEIIQQPTKHTRAIGKVIEVLGDHMAPGMEIDVAIRSYQLPNTWSAEVLRELDTIADTVTVADLSDRHDLRDLSFVTIDGEDARDFDDAICCTPTKKGWHLLVAIADVSHYVSAGSALDLEAYQRGNSVYFPERVIPMLPEKLSNGLCSLNPNVDRLCMVADMLIDRKGKIKKAKFYSAVMHSKARLTYTQVGDWLAGDESALKEDIQPYIQSIHDLYQVLHKARVKRGALDLDTTETKIVFGKNKKIEKIVPVVRNDAHKLIEECMLCANVASAQFIKSNKLVSLFRVHGSPGADKVEKFKTFAHDLGLPFTRSAKPGPKDYAEILALIKGRPDQHIIQLVLLRTLSQAVYTPDNEGHFGLAYKGYTHFTSPIRRYPDLLLHRVIKQSLSNEKQSDTNEAMQVMGQHCSSTERRADEATRDAVDWLKCEHMLDRVGEEYDGIVSGVTGFGLFIELKDIYVEGLVHITNLEGDYYCLDAMRHMLRGERTGQTYQLGDLVRVRVDRVDLDERHIDFHLVQDSPPASKKKSKQRKKIKKTKGK